MICNHCGYDWGNQTTHTCGGRTVFTYIPVAFPSREIARAHRSKATLKRAVCATLAWLDDLLHCNIRPLCYLVCDLQMRGWDE